MEKRKQQRIKINNHSVVVSDGMGPCQGMVSDISASGMRIHNLPGRLNMSSSQLSVILTEKNKVFRMNVTPKWYFEKDGLIVMGVKIANTPLKWNDIVPKLAFIRTR